MYPNIDAEQARLKITNAEMASHLGIYPYTYGQKKMHGGFTVKEAQIICKVLKSRFEYLFDTKVSTGENTNE